MVDATNSPSNRGLQATLPTSYATYVDRWAIVVGISEYKDSSINLKYADRDAEALYELLKTPTGGGFEEAHICKLVNEKATTANITRALRSFLKKPGKEDIVLLYFACHGAPDRDRPDILYLLTHDTDPKDIAGTALPMREINLSLRENLLAERVIIVADTCHSAGISKAGTRDAGENSGVINRYLQEVGESQKGIALLTSAEANQVSFEDEKWGGGHGVFTHYLLEGMKGAADRSPKNGIVTAGELFEYVRENVKRATEDKQHPCIGPDSFDRNLPVAITAGISAQEHYELGCQLYQIALKLDDKYCFEAASRHLREAIRQAATVGSRLPEAHLQLGLALTTSGNLPEEAVTAFEKAIKAGLPDADYYLGTAYLNQGEVEAARQRLEAFLSKQPDNDKAGAVQELMSWFEKSNSSHSEAENRYALLIGINYSKLEDPQYRPLKGPVNDIEILNDVLSQKYGFKTTMLSDMEATYENIVKAFHELQELTKPTDVVIIYFAGYESGDNLVAANTILNDKGNRLNIISSKELHSLIYAIPSLHKHLILDVCINSAFEGFINQINQTKICTLLLSNSLGQFAYEVKIEDTQKTHGYFTYTLVHELEKAPEDILQRTLFEQVKKAVETKYPKQTPFFIGDLDKPLFCADLEYCPDLFTFSQRRCYSAFDDRSLHSLKRKVEKQLTTLFPDFYYSLGLAFLQKNNYVQALASLKTAVDHTKHHDDFLGNIILAVDSVTKSKRCALLVEINNYSINYNTSTSTNALSLRDVLVSEFGFQTEDIKVLLNQDATYQNILIAFRELVDISQINSTLFYFSGAGSIDIQDNPTILAFDSRQEDNSDILLTELSQLANQSEVNLVSVIDSCWTVGGMRYTKPNETVSFCTRATQSFLSDVDQGKSHNRDNSKIPKIGCVSIYPESIKFKHKDERTSDLLTFNFIKFLLAYQSKEHITYQMLRYFCDNMKMHFVGDIDILEQTLFNNHVLESKVHAPLIEIEQESIRYTILILKRLIEQRNGAAPEELFNLGIAYYRLNEYDKSITALQSTIDQVSGQNNATAEGQTPSQRSYPEAHYWLGRVLYESKRDPAHAVSELRLATQQSPDNIAAHYYLGKALRALVEQEILTEAERAFQTYLNAGAPLGQQEEVQEFFKSRKETEKN